MINKLKKSNLFLVITDIIFISICYILALYVLGYENLSDIIVIENIILSIFVYQVFLNLFKMYLNMVNYEIGKDYLKYIV